MNTKQLVTGALIAAIYALLTLAVAPISYGMVQCRVSEALCVLPLFTPAAVPGLFVGCIIANLLGSADILDIVFGSFATLAAAASTYAIGKKYGRKITLALAPFPAVLYNALIVGYLLSHVYSEGSFLLCALYVGAGQAIACYGLGIPVTLMLRKYEAKIFGVR